MDRKKIYHLLILIFILLQFSKLAFASHRPNQSIIDTTLADHYYAYAHNLYTNAKYDSAIWYLSRAITLYEKILPSVNNKSLWAKYINCFNWLGRNSWKRSDFSDARIYLEKALRMGLEKLSENDIVVGNSYYEMGLFYTETSEYQKAENSINKSLRIRELIVETDSTDDNQRKIANCYDGLGFLLLRKGFYKRSERYLQKSLDMLLKLTTKYWLDIAAVYHDLAYAYEEQGDYDKSLEYYHKCLEIRYKLLDANHREIAVTLNNIGLVHTERNEYDRALYYHQKSLQIRLNVLNKDDLEIAFSYNNIGLVKYLMGNNDEALDYLTKALNLEQKHFKNKNHYLIICSYYNIGNCYRQKKQFKKAIHYYHKALAMGRAVYGDKHPTNADLYYMIGITYEELGHYQTALSYYQKSLIALALDFQDHSIEVNPPLKNINSDLMLLQVLEHKGDLMGKLYREKAGRGYLECSLAAYQRAIELVDIMRIGFSSDNSKLFLSEHVSSLYEKAIKTSFLLFKISNDRSFKEKTFCFSQKAKANLLLEKIQETKAKHFSRIPIHLLRKEDSLKTNIAFYNIALKNITFNRSITDSLLFQKYKEHYFNLKQQFEQLQREFEHNYPEYYQLKYQTRVASLHQVQNSLRQDTALLEYEVLTDHIYIFYLSNNDFEIITVAADSTLKANAHAMLEGITQRKYISYVRNAHLLYEKLFRPIEPLVLNKHKIVVIPDDFISNIPFEALLAGDMIQHNEQPWYKKLPYLIHNYTISYSYCTTLYLESLKSRTQTPVHDFLAFAPTISAEIGNAPPGTNRNNSRNSIDTDNSYLPAAIEEVSAIDKIFNRKYGIFDWLRNKLFNHSTRVYLKKDATEEKLKLSTSQDYRYIHLATHGIVNHKIPALSNLRLRASSKSEDGILYLEEIYNLKLNADMVVLSACQTAEGKWVEGEGLMSFTRGFLYAGARNLIVSLWKVNDSSTSKLMIQFYYYLLNGNSKADALKKAKEMMIEAGFDFAMPYYWAPFILIGQ